MWIKKEAYDKIVENKKVRLIMQVKIIAVGKLKEKYLVQGINEYAKRLSRYTQLTFVEVPDEKVPEKLHTTQMTQAKEKEGQQILAKLSEEDYVIALAIEGAQPTSEQLAKKIEELTLYGTSKITFVIGGSLGLSQAVLKRSQQHLSFGKLTYPHQLMRLILVEQIYRSFRIIKNEPYHK